MYQYVFGIIFNIFELILFLIGVYYTAIAFFSLFSLKKASCLNSQVHFAAVIPAHNEADVISSLIDSIKTANYPSELIDIYVVADGCSDNTAETARRRGAYVLEKPFATCKGDALRFAFDHIKNVDFDYVAVFDADNIVHPNFFSEINRVASAKVGAVQGYIDSKNPYASWVSNAHSIWYWLTNRTIQTGRNNLNLGCRIGGTGFALSKETLLSNPWDTETLAEDSEYTCRLALSGINVSYVNTAVVYDEKPVSFSQSVHQRKRWATGLRDVQGEYTIKLLLKGKLNAALGLWSDFLYPFSCFALLFISLFSNMGIFTSTAGKAVLCFYLAANLAISLIALMADKKLNYKNVLNIFGFVLYMASWLPIGFFGIFDRDSQKWYHTLHGTESRK